MRRYGTRAIALAILIAGSLTVLGWEWRVPRIDKGELGPRPGGTAVIPPARRVRETFGRLLLYFIENRGQLDAQVAYYVPGEATCVYFTASGVTFALPAEEKASPPSVRRTSGNALPIHPPSSPEMRRWAVKLEFLGARTVRPEGDGDTGAVFSYFKGPREQWKTGLRSYSRIVYRDLWPGIDLVYGGTAGRLKYEFIVRPGARPEQIRLVYRGTTGLRVSAEGQLEVSSPVGGFRDERPYAYQDEGKQRREIAASYSVSDDGAYGFEVGEYDRRSTLVVDPAVLMYAGYIGGAGTEYGGGIAVDTAGNAYVTGSTRSNEGSFPVKVGPVLTHKGNFDAFVAKVNPEGTGLVYAGYIGGAQNDSGLGIAVDAAGNAYVSGTTESNQTLFPVTIGPGLMHKGGQDAFVAKVNAAGTSLIYAGYIGGSGEDSGLGIAVDTQGNAYLTGFTNSPRATFPIKVGPGLNTGGMKDAFVAKVNAAGTDLVYAGYIAGGQDDIGRGIAVDAAGNAYVTGYTESRQPPVAIRFPVQEGPSLTYGGNGDAFVAKVKADGTAFIYAGYIGGSEQDEGVGIAVDADGSAYVTGWTYSTEASFPVKVGPGLTYGGNGDAFVAKVKANGTGLVYAGYIGGSSNDLGIGIAVDAQGNAYVGGQTYSTPATFPVKVGPTLTHSGSQDVFVAKVKADGTALVYAGYVGGRESETCNGIAVDAAGNAYITGATDSTEATFPVKVGPSLTYQGVIDAFVAKIGPGTPVISQVVDGGGWKTIFTLVNLQATAADFRLRFWKDDGTPLRLTLQGAATASEILQGTIPANGSRTIETQGVDDAVSQGWAELVTATSTIGGLAVFRHRVPGIPDQEAAVNLVPSVGRFALLFDNTQGAITGVALVNSNALLTAASSAAFRGEDGAPISSAPANLSPHSHTAFAMPDLFPSLANRRGVAEFSSPSSDFGALGLRFDPGGAFTSFPALPFDESTLNTGGRTVSQVADGAGWKTTFLLVNLDTVSAPFTWRFWKDDGNPLRLSFEGAIGGASEIFTGTIPVGGSITLASRGVDQALSQGWADLSTSRAVSGFAVFRHRVPGSSDQEAAVPITPAVKRFVLPFDNTQGFVTAMALLNANAAQTLLVSVVIRDEAGTQIAPDALALLARAHIAFALPDRFPATANRRGVIEFSAPTADLSALGLRFNPSGAFTSFPIFAK